MVISQKHLNFRTKRACKVQDNTGGNGLGNRCSIQKAMQAPLIDTSRPSSAQGRNVSIRRVSRAETWKLLVAPHRDYGHSADTTFFSVVA
jgi:hypothetical protein